MLQKLSSAWADFVDVSLPLILCAILIAILGVALGKL